MRRSARFLLVVLVTFATAGCDQATKHVARSALAAAPGVSLLGDSVHFELAYNRGGFLSVGENSPPSLRRIVFGVVVPASLAIVACAAVFGHAFARRQVMGLALILGGGAGNLIDRLVNDGAVTDFVRLGIGPLSTGVFNVGDIAILLGVAIIALAPELRAERADT